MSLRPVLLLVALCLATSAPAQTNQPAAAYGVEFSLFAPNAKHVNLAGDFNNWSSWSRPMLQSNGQWRTTIQMSPGRHQYKFIVDGRWIADPMNPDRQADGFGGTNTVVWVRRDYTNEAPQRPVGPSARPLSPYGIEIALNAPDAKAVSVVGDFNNWTPSPMHRRPDGAWVATVRLPVGQYQYKFVVDGKEMADPDNPYQADDGKGGRNSVMTFGR
jgi:1,4-alpha-glucan branching enzyme